MIIGVTGQFCAGKSLVAGIFRRLGAKVIDVDKIGHRVLLKKQVSRRLTVSFGTDILDKNGKINRRKLAHKVFLNKAAHKALCRIVHPVLIRETKDELSRLKSKFRGAAVVIDAAVLLEMGLSEYVDKIVLIKAKRKKQVDRAYHKCGVKRKDAIKRISLQFPLKRLIREADFTIDNSGDFENTAEQVKKIWNNLWRAHGK